MDLGDIIAKMWNEFSQLLGVLIIMFLIVIGVGKTWDKAWHPAIKITMVLVVFIVEMSCIFVLPLDIGKNVRDTVGNLI